MPDKYFDNSLDVIAWWVNRISKNIGDREEEFFKIIDRIIKTHTKSAEDSDHFSFNQAINHPVGRIAMSLLDWWFSKEIEDGQGLPEELKDRFKEMCSADNQPLLVGSVILAHDIMPLLRVDQGWTKQYLIPAFEWDTDLTKTAAMWDGFLHNPSDYLPLLELLKSPFLAVPDHIEHLDEQCLQRYARFLTYIALREASVFEPNELKTVFSKLPAEHLEKVAETLFRALQGAGDQKEEYLKNRVTPFVNGLWPSKTEAQTPKVSMYFAQMVAVSGSVFEQAFDTFRYYLIPTTQFGYLLELLNEGKLAAEHPSEILQLLDCTIPEHVDYLHEGLGPLLQTIKDVDEDLSRQQAFRRLDILQQQHMN